MGSSENFRATPLHARQSSTHKESETEIPRAGIRGTQRSIENLGFLLLGNGVAPQGAPDFPWTLGFCCEGEDAIQPCAGRCEQFAYDPYPLFGNGLFMLFPV